MIDIQLIVELLSIFIIQHSTILSLPSTICFVRLTSYWKKCEYDPCNLATVIYSSNLRRIWRVLRLQSLPQMFFVLSTYSLKSTLQWLLFNQICPFLFASLGYYLYCTVSDPLENMERVSSHLKYPTKFI